MVDRLMHFLKGMPGAQEVGNGSFHRQRISPAAHAHRAFQSVPGMARIQSEIDRSQVVTAKCSEPQVVDSDVRDGGSGVAILSSVRTETGYKAKWWIRLHNKPKSKR